MSGAPWLYHSFPEVLEIDLIIQHLKEIQLIFP